MNIYTNKYQIPNKEISISEFCIWSILCCFQQFRVLDPLRKEGVLKRFVYSVAGNDTACSIPEE